MIAQGALLLDGCIDCACNAFQYREQHIIPQPENLRHYAATHEIINLDRINIVERAQIHSRLLAKTA